MAGMGGIKDSTTLEQRADMKAPTVSELGAGMKDHAAQTPVVVDFTGVGLQTRTPKPARVLVPLEGMSMGAPRAATRIGVPRACTAVALAAAID